MKSDLMLEAIRKRRVKKYEDNEPALEAEKAPSETKEAKDLPDDGLAPKIEAKPSEGSYESQIESEAQKYLSNNKEMFGGELDEQDEKEEMIEPDMGPSSKKGKGLSQIEDDLFDETTVNRLENGKKPNSLWERLQDELRKKKNKRGEQ